MFTYKKIQRIPNTVEILEKNKLVVFTLLNPQFDYFVIAVLLQL